MSIVREWYYADNTEPVGPVTADFLHQLLQNGVLQSDSLVWRQGNPAWQRMIEALPPAEAASDAPVANPNQPEQIPHAVRALGTCAPQLWRRLCARVIDTGLMLIILSAIMYVAMPNMVQESIDTLRNETAPVNLWWFVAQNIAIFSLVSLANGLLTALTGASLGKRLFRLQVVNASGKPLGLKAGLLREGHILLRMLVLMIPVTSWIEVALMALLLSLSMRNLAKQRPQWDTACRAYTITSPMNIWELSGRMSITLLLCSILGTATVMTQQELAKTPLPAAATATSATTAALLPHTVVESYS